MLTVHSFNSYGVCAGSLPFFRSTEYLDLRVGFGWRVCILCCRHGFRIKQLNLFPKRSIEKCHSCVKQRLAFNCNIFWFNKNFIARRLYLCRKLINIFSFKRKMSDGALFTNTFSVAENFQTGIICLKHHTFCPASLFIKSENIFIKCHSFFKLHLVCTFHGNVVHA